MNASVLTKILHRYIEEFGADYASKEDLIEDVLGEYWLLLEKSKAIIPEKYRHLIDQEFKIMIHESYLKMTYGCSTVAEASRRLRDLKKKNKRKPATSRTTSTED